MSLSALSVGARISVFWAAEDQSFSGRVVAIDAKRSRWRVLYDDDDNRWHDLRSMPWALESDAAELERSVRTRPAAVAASAADDAGGQPEVTAESPPVAAESPYAGEQSEVQPPVTADSPPVAAESPSTGCPAVGERVELYDVKQDAWRPGTVEEVRATSSTFVVRFACGIRREHHVIADVWRREHAAHDAIETLRVGSRLSVYWPGENACFAGRLGAYNDATRLWLVNYDDGDSRWHNLLACLWMPAAQLRELELHVQRISPLALTTAVARPAQLRISRPPRAALPRLEYFPAGVVRMRGALDLSDQRALVDCSLIAGYFHRTTVMDGVYTRALGQPDIKLHWNYYSPPEREQPPPLSALELATRALKLIRSELWDATLAEQSLCGQVESERAPLRVPPLPELEVGSVLGITYGHADSMHWHTDMATEAGWCASLSVGAPAKFEFIPLPCEPRATARSAAREHAAPVSLVLESGDVLLFNGGRLQHRIVSIEPVLAGSASDCAHICAPLGPNVARLVVQARTFSASSAHSYPALLDAGYAAPEDVCERGRLALAATRAGAAAAAQGVDGPKSSKRAREVCG